MFHLSILQRRYLQNARKIKRHFVPQRSRGVTMGSVRNESLVMTQTKPSSPLSSSSPSTIPSSEDFVWLDFPIASRKNAMRGLLQSLQTTTSHQFHQFKMSSEPLLYDLQVVPEEVEEEELNNHENDQQVHSKSPLLNESSVSIQHETLQPQIQKLMSSEMQESLDFDDIMIPTNSDTNCPQTDHSVIETSASTAGIKVNHPSSAFEIKEEFVAAITQEDYLLAVHILEQSQQHNLWLPIYQLQKLFFSISKTHPIQSFQVLTYYHNHPKCKGAHAAMYKHVCDAIRDWEKSNLRARDTYELATSLIASIEKLDHEFQQKLFPRLITNFVVQRNPYIGQLALPLYEKMVHEDMFMSNIWLRDILGASKYNRQNELPYHDVFRRIVSTGYRPYPLVIIRMFHNMFPFMEIDKVIDAMETLSELHQTGEPDGFHPIYPIDMNTLESISFSAARSTNQKLILLVWDVLEQLKYKPTEAIYENTIVTFASSRRTMKNAFDVLIAMTNDGFTPSTALLRSFSLMIRSERQAMQTTFNIVTNGQAEDGTVTRECINVVLSGYAERGDLERAVQTFQELERQNIKPNDDSFSFLMESIGKAVNLAKVTKNVPITVDKFMDVAMQILAAMDDLGIVPSPRFIRNYVELLCLVGEIETATAVVLDHLEGAKNNNNRKSTQINSKTLYRVGVENLNQGNDDIAQRIANAAPRPVPMLQRAIQYKKERREEFEVKSANTK